MSKPKLITQCRITAMPKSFFDPMPQVMVKLAFEKEEQLLFEFYPDEISFTESEFIGLTIEEAKTLKGKKDRNYLKS